MIDLIDIQTAAERMAGHVRRTPTVAASGTRTPATAADLFLKLELLQVSGSFKARGVTSKVRSLAPEVLSRGLVTASGGNHGLAVARAGWSAGVPTKIFLAATVSPAKLARFAEWGASAEVVDGPWDAANEAARAYARDKSATYIHPFSDPLVVAGQGTIGLELMEDLPNVDVVIAAIGGGGLISGLGTALKALSRKVRILGVEPVGSPTLKRSLEAGSVVILPEVTTRVATMACRQTDEAILRTVERVVDDIVLVEDEEMQHAAEWLWFEFGLAADLSGAAAVAALLSGRIALQAGTVAAALVCGAGPEGVS